MKEYSLVVAAMDEEMSALLNLLPNPNKIEIKGEELYEFTLNGEDYLLGRGKIGKVHTAVYLTKLFEELKIKRVFNIGTSGGIKSDLKISDVVIASRVAYHDVDVTGFNYEIGQLCGCPTYFDCDMEYVNSKVIDPKYNVVKGLVVSGDQFITKSNLERSHINEFENVIACEMEASAVGQVCHLYKIPFVVVRSISDIVTKEENAKAFDSNIEVSSTNSALVLLELIK